MHSPRSAPDEEWLKDNWENTYCLLDGKCSERFLLKAGGKHVGFTIEFVILYIKAFGPPCFLYSFAERARSDFASEEAWTNNFSGDNTRVHFKYANARVDGDNEGTCGTPASRETNLKWASAMDAKLEKSAASLG